MRPTTLVFNIHGGKRFIRQLARYIEKRFGIKRLNLEFSRAERKAWEDLIKGFEDALVMSSSAPIFPRHRSRTWKPQPYLAQK